MTIAGPSKECACSDRLACEVDALGILDLAIPGCPQLKKIDTLAYAKVP